MLLSPFVAQDLRVFVAKESAETLTAINDLVEAGKVAPVEDRSYPIVRAGDAISRLEAGANAGRLALAW
jgi:NADPH:quinone reductase-like Zn-dependent oxidoreductase